MLSLPATRMQSGRASGVHTKAKRHFARLDENEPANPEIVAITGRTMKQVEAILEKYMARMRALNDAATRKLEQSWVAQVALA